jgi:hypothetical protein
MTAGYFSTAISDPGWTSSHGVTTPLVNVTGNLSKRLMARGNVSILDYRVARELSCDSAS